MLFNGFGSLRRMQGILSFTNRVGTRSAARAARRAVGSLSRRTRILWQIRAVRVTISGWACRCCCPSHRSHPAATCLHLDASAACVYPLLAVYIMMSLLPSRALLQPVCMLRLPAACVCKLLPPTCTCYRRCGGFCCRRRCLH
jgi:hypothetical protein